MLLSRVRSLCSAKTREAILPGLFPWGLGVQCTLDCPRLRAWPILTPNLLLFVFGAKWPAKCSAYNNYFVTIIQRGGWSLGSANSAAEVGCSSEMTIYRCNPCELMDRRNQIIVRIC